MREIKFRAWDKQLKRMCAPYDGDFITWRAPTNWKEFYLLMEFSGLKDSKDVDIYEGDIVYLAGFGNCLIEFPFLELYAAAVENDIGEIVGNVHENQDLVTQ